MVVASGSRIGIAAGASTPGWAIKEVVNKMEEKTKGLNGELEGAMTSEGAGLDQANANEAEQATQVVGQPEQTESAAPQDTDAAPAQEQDGIGGPLILTSQGSSRHQLLMENSSQDRLLRMLSPLLKPTRLRFPRKLLLRTLPL